MRKATAHLNLALLTISFVAACARPDTASDLLEVRRSAVVTCTQTPVAVSAGSGHTCALLPDATVECWGWNLDGQLGDGTTSSSPTPTPVSGLSGVAAIATGSGSRHTCAVRTNGTVTCWGYNLDGDLGNGTTTNSSIPIAVTGLSGVVAVATGASHTCALRAAGTVACWGSNSFGQLGNGSTVSSSTPVDVTGLSDVTAIAVGNEATCALLSGGTVRCWGSNVLGALGNQTMESSSTPVSVSGLAGVTAIAMNSHVCAVLSSGQLACWGQGIPAEADGGAPGDGSTARLIPGVTGVVDVTAGAFFSCARTSAGGAICWGDNRFEQVTSGVTSSAAPPTPKSGLTGATAISAGGFHACALRADGLQCWGASGSGQLGTGLSTSPASPETVSLGGPSISVAAGGAHSCALLATGRVRCWGENTFGQLGVGTLSVRLLTNELISLPSDITQLAAGGRHTCARRITGSVFCWGDNSSGQLGIDAVSGASTPVSVLGVTEVTQISTGAAHTCERSTEGAIACWGDNALGQLGTGTTVSTSVPTGIFASGVEEVAVGGYHSCARFTGGTVSCWGYNGDGELGNGTTTNSLVPIPVPGLTGVTQISLGDSHSCALRSDGSVACWGGALINEIFRGRPPAGPLVPTPVPGVANATKIAAGGYHTCALLADNKVSCWGHNGDGQVGNGTTSRSSGAVLVSGLGDVVDISAGGTHSCSVQGDGVVKCWGRNYFGQIGNGVVPDAPSPVDVICSAANAPGVNGIVCASSAECASGFCVDGVCCETECGGGDPHDCQACALAAGGSLNGTCTFASASTVCHAATSLCESTQLCSGGSASCPALTVLPPSMCTDVVPGTSVPIPLAGGIDAVGGLTLEFPAITSSGEIAVAASGAGNPPGPLPTGFKIVTGTTGLYYWDIDTNATYTPPIEICVHHAPAVNECTYRLLHDSGSGFQNITTSHCDRTGHLCSNPALTCAEPSVICGSTNSLSPFALVEPIDSEAPTFVPVPADIVAYATSTAGASLGYTPPLATDAVDGVRPVACTPASGATFAPGKTPVTCTTSDLSGNTTTATFTVWVQFQAPADGSFFLKPPRANGSSVFRIGRPVAVKFQLTGASKNITNLEAHLIVTKVSNTIQGTIDDECDEDDDDTDFLFKYRPGKKLYAYRWKTRNQNKGTYELRADLGDGVVHQVRISLKR